MPMPGAMPGYSAASNDLGLGNILAGQVKDETDELRKKRLQQQQSMGQGGAAASMLLGMPGGYGT